MAASTRSKAGDSNTSNSNVDEKSSSQVIGASLLGHDNCFKHSSVRSSTKDPQLTGLDTKGNTTNANDNGPTTQPLGPPPRPSQSGNDKGDYFAQSHSASNNKNNHKGGKANGIGYHTEPNPFEEQFGNPSTDTPGKLGLPPVASLTSPSSLMPTDTPGWNSLRSGPLSPAMLAGPAGNDYFDQPYGRGFPTPNESSLRTGLTPGGGGSMFPAPSPGTAAMFNAIGLNTPNTMDFMRSSMAARNTNGAGPTSQPADTQTSQSMSLRLPAAQSNNAFDNSANPDADAVNGLFMLAQSNGARTGGAVNAVTQPPTVQINSTTVAPSVQPVAAATTRGRKISVESQSANDPSDSEEEPPKPAPKGRKRGAAGESKPTAARRKATDTPIKTPAPKKAKTSIIEKFETSPMMDDDDDDDDEEDEHMVNGKDTRKMTDEEKRKNFLERNRVAALKCRQRKKQWLANLQNKCDLYSQENDALSHTVNQLREQVFQLKQVLITHKDCPAMAQQGFSQQVIANLVNQDIMMGFVPPNNGGHMHGRG